MPLQVVVMGVTATGKTAVGTMLADRLAWRFVEGDDLHPPGNVAKMATGAPLTDADRAPWLELINDRAREMDAVGESAIITCSALKRQYRATLRRGVDAMFFVHLHADQQLIERRIAAREGHFMPPSLVQSQFDTLEPLADDEDGTVIDVSGPVDDVTADALRAVRGRLRS